MKNWIVKGIATGLFSGYSPLVPGTVGTIPAWLLLFFVVGTNQIALLAVTALFIAVSVWAAGEAERLFGHDAKKIVIDEWAGMAVAVLFVPISFTNYLIAFLAFRFFDVVKLPPASQFERLPGGWGVTMDDVAAGVHANIAVQIYLLVVRYWYS
ncbi:MAG: phosphatidylglycerophosphatase A [candidate division Zixibacteria bacterium]|nr:phosphatidylglycerophosphatase A [candidate division Zixibacteria bacterium]